MKKNGASALVLIIVVFVFAALYSTYNSTAESEENAPAYEASVIYETDLFRITTTNIETTAKATEVGLLIENLSTSNAVMSCTSYIVNEMMIDTFTYAEVAAEASATCSIYLDSEDLQKSGIKKITQIIPYDSYVSFESGEKYPIDFCVSVNKDHTQTVNEEGKLLYSQNGITVISKLEPGTNSKKIPMLIKNESGQDLHIGTSYVTINGFTVPEVQYYSPICDGTYRYFEIEISPFEKDNPDLNKIESASFCLSFMKPNSTQVIFQTEQLYA